MFILLTRHVTGQGRTLLFGHHGNILLFMDKRIHVTKQSLEIVKGGKKKCWPLFQKFLFLLVLCLMLHESDARNN